MNKLVTGYRPLLAMETVLKILALFIGAGLFAACSGGSERHDLAMPRAQEAIGRGSELVEGLAACGFCHGVTPKPDAALAGGRTVVDRYGAVVAPNITTDESGLAGWSVREVVDAVRSSVSSEGEQLSPDVHRGYEWLSERDILAVVAYLATLPPVENSTSRRSISWFSRNTTGMFVGYPGPSEFVTDIDPQNQIEYGRYLVDHVARCGSCHSGKAGLFGSERYLAGGKRVYIDGEDKEAPNITFHRERGIGGWSASEIVKYLKSGQTPSGRTIDSRFCPVEFYSTAPARDLEAVAAYLMTVPPLD